MSRGGKVPASLHEYFERRRTGSGEARAEPLGYRCSLHKHKANDTAAVLHEASGIHVGPFPIDCVEQMDRAKPPPGVQYVYAYLPCEAFGRIAGLAQREPRAACQALQKAGAMSVVEGEGGEWYGKLTSWEPATVAKNRQGDRTRGVKGPWYSEDFCIALRLLSRQCRPPAGGEAVEICFEDAAEPRQLGTNLIKAAIDRDKQAIRTLLFSKADPDFQDPRGWTALHAACSVRPQWEVLRQLIRMGDPCLRTHRGELPCDIADAAGFTDVAQVLKQLMQLDEKSKHLPQAMSVLSAEMSAKLGLHTMDHSMAELKGRRREATETNAMLKTFAMTLMKKYSDVAAAFKAFDVNQTGVLTAFEFTQYAGQMCGDTDITALFKALDYDRLGDISMSEFSILQEIYDVEMEKERKEKERKERSRLLNGGEPES